MNRILLSLVLAVCCVAGVSGQVLQRDPAAGLLMPHAVKAPVARALGENQLYLGPYASDALAEYGLGLPGYSGVFKMGTVLPVSMLQPFDGGMVKAIRFGLCAPVTDAMVFLMPVTSLDPLTVGDPLVQQSVTGAKAGWNQVQLNNPVTISTQGIVGLMLGYQYRQIKGDTDACFPISVVDEGTILDTYTSGTALTGGEWQDLGMSAYGNLSVQAIVEKDFPDYNLSLGNLRASRYARVSQGLDFSVGLSNIGLQTLWDYTVDMLVDDVLMGQIQSPEALTQAEVVQHCTCPLGGVASGKHTLTLRVATVAGEAVDNGATVSTEFVAYANSYPRQRHLVEQFTSQAGANCPKGDAVLETLQQMRDDMEWVAIHCNIGGTDQLSVAQGIQVANYLGCTSVPAAAFNRYTASGGMVQSIAYDPQHTQQAADVLSYTYFDGNDTPAMATVSVEPTYDEAARALGIKVMGQLAQDIVQVMEGDIALSVYLTEDSVVARQKDGGNWNQNYIHRHVLRAVPSAFNGDLLTTGANAFVKNYQLVLPAEWKPQHMRIVALVHRRGATNDAKQVINCEAVSLFEHTAIVGDINGDGVVDIADVNAVINMMLGKVESVPAADINGDGHVDIADVNAVINAMLGKS